MSRMLLLRASEYLRPKKNRRKSNNLPHIKKLSDFDFEKTQARVNLTQCCAGRTKSKQKKNTRKHLRLLKPP